MTTGADIAESLPGGERTGEGSGTVPRIVVRGGEQPMAPAEAATQTSVGETPTKPGAVASTAPARPLPTAVRALGPAGAV
ncbi:MULTISPECIES: hypothetical protein, partial [unclassified Streptomyces]|uniref:hypothetical protein n=1 Tax=unclassified Streptomyces TaxID=2593676 RepID=UPI00081DEFBF